jgi:hypothetical protein
MTDMVAARVAREAEAARDLLRSLAEHDEETRHDMAEAETSFFEAIDAALTEIDSCAAIVAGCDAQLEMYQARKSKFQARAERLRGLIEQAMVFADVPSIRRPMATLTVKATKPAPIIADEAEIPARFWKPQAPKLDKAAINQAVKDGETIPGVSKTNGGTSLQIRRV